MGTGETRYQYNPAGRLTGIKFPTGSLNGAQLGYDPDILDRVSKVKVKTSSSGREYLIEYRYHANGQIELIRVYDPTTANLNTIVLHTTTFTYDDVRRVSTRTHSMAGIAAPVSTYTYKTPVANVAPGSWTEYAVNDLVTHIDHSRASVPIVRLTYERLPGGEPQKIWYNESSSGVWNAGEFVTMAYTNGLRVSSEDWSTAADLAYSYNDAGSRLTRAWGAAVSTATYKPGFQINGITGSGGAVSEVWGYDLGGRVTSLNRGTPSRSMTWTAADQLKTVTVGSATTTYKYDPMGRRSEAIKGATTRRFIIGPTAGTGLEVIHAVGDGTGTLQALYVYHGDRPIIRFTVDGTGKPVNPVYYLEDAQGSVVALTDGAGTTTRFRYDAFGVPRTDASHADPSVSGIPAGTGGDFRFHGLWLEADTGFYYARARDYDPQSGTFLSRDPAEGATTAPESYHAYNFADSNPLVYKDPTGAFTVLEVSFAGAGQFSEKTSRSVGVSYIKSYAQSKIQEFAFGQIGSALQKLVPTEPWQLPEWQRFYGNDASFTGRIFETAVLSGLCKLLGDDVRIEPMINNRTGALFKPGFRCNHPGFYRTKPYPIPDFLVTPGSGKAYVVGEIKLQATGLLRYFTGNENDRRQWDAITKYAALHTHSRVSLFLTLSTGKNGAYRSIASTAARNGARRGSIVVVVSAIDGSL